MRKLIQDYKILEYGIKISKEKENLFILPLSPKIIRVVYSEEGEISKTKSLMVVDQLPFSDWASMEEEFYIEVRTTELKVRIDKITFGISYYNSKNELLLKEPEKGGKTLEKAELIKTRFDKNTEIEMEVTVDGLRMKNRAGETYIDRTSYHGKLEFEWQDLEALYGLGSHEDGVLNLRGTHQYLYQQNMKACVPMLVSTKGYGLLIDNYSFMTFHDDMYGSYLWMEYAEQIDYYFIYGEELTEITKGYHQLTGEVSMLPKWAFGYVQSKERYVDDKELIKVVKEYRDREIPLDCIVLDWHSWEGDLWGEKVFDSSRFPNPKEMVDRLHEMDAKLMISIWPNMAPGGTNSNQMLEKGYMLGNQSTYDAFNKEARELYWKQAEEGLFSSGLDAWWCDCTEPFEGDWKGTMKPEPEARIDVNTREAKMYLDPAYISAYSLLHSEGIYEGQRKATGEKRVINLTRSSYAGQHRYATITWSGDTAGSWDTLRKQIPAGLNFCITGEPYWTTDIGGFFVRRKEQWFWAGEYEKGCDDMGYRELYLRWFQYGTFLPMFRSHGTDTPREVWRFGEKGDVIYDSLVRFTHLRYSLMPYIYSLAGRVTLFGESIIKPLGIVFREDERTFDTKDQYMFGDSLLICPITEPYYYEVDSREIRKKKETKVYLPAGHEWYDFWTKEKFTGGQTITREVSLETIPVFVKAGSIIPMSSNQAMHTGELKQDELKVLIYGGADAEFILYEDEGDGYGYENSQYACTVLRWEDEKELLSTEVTGDYKGFIKDKKIQVEVIR